MKKDIKKWCDFHKIPWDNIVDCRSKKSLVVEVKASKSDAVSDSKLEPERGRQIINAEPNTIFSTTKIQHGELDEPKKGECLFHS
jgi:hypothetical protein